MWFLYIVDLNCCVFIDEAFVVVVAGVVVVVLAIMYVELP